MTRSDRANAIRARLDAPAHVQGMLHVLRARAGVDLEVIRRDPIGWLDSWEEIELVDLGPSQATADDRCSIDGLYRDDPPRIAIAMSDTEARMNFSALHELGHHIQTTDLDLATALASRPDGGEALEEIACDRFAAEILIPDETARRFLQDGVPRADDVADLWRSLGTVSRSAVAIRAVRDVEIETVVLILDAAGSVTFATGTTAIRPPRGTDQTRSDIWDAITRAGMSGTAQTRSQLAYAIGPAGPVYYAQAARMGSGYVVVAATDHVPWRSLSVAQNEYAPTGTWTVCVHPACGHEFRATEPPHEACGVPVCPECGRCGCTVAARREFTCSVCMTRKGAALMSSTQGVCVDCE